MYDVIVLGATFAAAVLPNNTKKSVWLSNAEHRQAMSSSPHLILQWQKPKFMLISKIATPCFAQNWFLCKKTATGLPVLPTVCKAFAPTMLKM